MQRTALIGVFCCAALLLLGFSACVLSESNQPASQNVTEAKAESAESKKTPAEKEPQPSSSFLNLATLEAADHPDQKRAIALVEEHTGLVFKKPVPVYVFAADDLQKEVASWGEGSQPENIMGFYTTRTEAMYVSPEVAGERRNFGLRVHELVHALQDQHYGLANLREGLTTSDQFAAVTGLIEGQATQVMIDALIKEQPHVAYIARAESPRTPSDPKAWSNVFHYAYGARFIQHLQNQNGNDSINAAFAEPPVSTEQILHPEKYDVARDDPVRIELDLEAIKSALPSSVKVGETDTLGEFGLIKLLVPHLVDPKQALGIAAGWDGDQILRCSVDGEEFLIGNITWDSVEDAREFMNASSELQETATSISLHGLNTRLIWHTTQTTNQALRDSKAQIKEALKKTKEIMWIGFGE